MKISDLFKMGLRSLSRRKARTVLTVIGVIIGSLSIIIVISIGKGMESNFDSQVMQQGGITTITVNTQADIFDDDGRWVSSKEQKLDDHLVEQIRTIKHVRAVSPAVTKYATLISGKYQSGINITAMDSSVFEAFDFPALEYGTYPSEEDKTQIILGSGQPYGFYDPYSRGNSQKQIDMQKSKVELQFNDFQPDPKKKAFTLPMKNISKMVQTNGEYDWNTYMDLDYFKEIYMKYCNTLSLEDRKKAIKTIEEYQQIKLNVDNVNNVTEVQEAIKELGYQSYSMMQYLEPLKNASKTMQIVIGILGAVAMVVSAINIANTMIMSIYERTKEIGVMKVLGCTVRDIRNLFLFEAAMIGLFGGLVGVILGYIASFLLNTYGGPVFGALMSGGYLNEMADTKYSIIPFYLPFVSLAISVTVGLLSGYFPALRATRISAIEAMKTEG
ncbi:MAG TPA: ABC transporter permease [Clostridiales bacterium]|nr:ABC transporter permease [Clostridiales bacterium]